MRVILGILLPFLGTAVGALAVYCMPKQREGLPQALRGLAAGVMTAASVWSLLLPAIAQSEALGAFSFLPAAVGFWCGVLLLLLLGRFEDRLQRGAPVDSTTRRMLLAIVLHNLPEGMAVGAAFAGVLAGSPGITMAGALALSLGIAIQNLPEGAIVSLPLHAAGVSRRRACCWGILSGAVEPLGAVLTMLAAHWMTPLLPYALSLAAGAMLHVVVTELAPTFCSAKAASVLFALGFTLMMALDVALG